VYILAKISQNGKKEYFVTSLDRLFRSSSKAIRFNYVAGIKDGVEAAPAYKKLLKQHYSFSGVPSNSTIRRYSNEYNKE